MLPADRGVGVEAHHGTSRRRIFPIRIGCSEGCLLAVLGAVVLFLVVRSAPVPFSVMRSREWHSPGGHLTACAYWIQGGGAAGWAETNIELRRRGEPLREGIALLDSDYGVVQRIDATWVDDHRIVIEVAIDRGRGTFRVGPESALGVRIDYRVLER